MEENLRRLLTDLIKQEKERKEATNNMKLEMEKAIERLSYKEETEIAKFTEGMKEDIKTGVYPNITESEMQRLIEETQNNIRERYNSEREQINNKLQEIENQKDESRATTYKQISSGIKDYHTDMVLEATKAKRELSRIEVERNEALQELDKKISEKEARRTHMIMRNRNSMDIEGSQVLADIRILETELEELKAEKDTLSSEFNSRIETQNQHLEYCIEQKERAAKFIGQVKLSEKSLEEIQQILFEGKELVVEEEQTVEIVEEEQPAEIVKEEQPAEVVEEEQPVEIVEEEQPAEIVKEEQPVKVAEEIQPVVNVKTDKSKNETKQPVIKQAQLSEEERNYKYFEANRESIIKFFMNVTGVKKNEATEIFRNREHCIAVGEICRVAMRQPKRDSVELANKLENYYWFIDSKLDIEVSNNGIQYNQELISPIDITEFGEVEGDFIDKIIEKCEEDLSVYRYASKNLVYDKNIITAIAMDNYKVGDDEKLQLTTSGRKKMAEYLDLIANPVTKKGTITYNLEKMSTIRGLFSILSWTPRHVAEFRKIAYKVKDTYAQVVPDKITKAKWAMKDWFKTFSTKKLGKGEQVNQNVVNENKEKRNNPWKLTQKEIVQEKSAEKAQMTQPRETTSEGR